MDLRKIKKLIELLEDSALTEMEISEGDSVIRLSRAAPQQSQSQSVVAFAEPAAPPPAQPPAEASKPPTDAQPGATATAGTVVVSPLVGTFYDSPSPDAEPFVKVGATVARGDTLCLIEAMKTFNHIDAEIAGVVTAAHKQTGEPVEYGEALFVIAGHGDSGGG